MDFFRPLPYPADTATVNTGLNTKRMQQKGQKNKPTVPPAGKIITVQRSGLLLLVFPKGRMEKRKRTCNWQTKKFSNWRPEGTTTPQGENNSPRTQSQKSKLSLSAISKFLL